MSKSSYPRLFTILNLVHSRIATNTLARTVKVVVIAKILIFREDDLEYHRVHRIMRRNGLVEMSYQRRARGNDSCMSEKVAYPGTR